MPVELAVHQRSMGYQGDEGGYFHFGFKAGIDWIAGVKLGRPHLRMIDDL